MLCHSSKKEGRIKVSSRNRQLQVIEAETELPRWGLVEHFNELRWRLLLYIVTYILLVAICAYYSEALYVWIAMPLFELHQAGGETHKLIFTGITEGFMAQMRLALYSAFALSLPMLLMQIYKFITPGLYERERKALRCFLIASLLLFIIGAALVYYFVMPAAWSFFLSFERYGAIVPIVLEARVSEYLDTVVSMMLSFGLAFQLPIILVLLARLKLVTASMLSSKRRHAIVLIFIIAAIMTPPDVITQVALAIPLLFLYEISIWAVRKYQN
ncbi:MAG: twin-arginine translocase subunit TatC [Proteobacteria bacterium]|nr:twin-arginine translocase subunit TatC [Pseudomonadota bacterium]